MANHTLSWLKNSTPEVQRFRCLPVFDVTTGNNTGDHKPVKLPLEGFGQGSLCSLELSGTGRKQQSTSMHVPMTLRMCPWDTVWDQAFLICNAYAHSLGLVLR